MIIFDNDLSPSQIAKIERITACRALDRSELILDIFAVHARSHEAKLQVELAQLEYTYPRLRAMWTHLKRISTSGSGARGPGEQPLELDRRIIRRRKTTLSREIATIQDRKHREVEKRNNECFAIGLVGYTNAGKSTLFNAATHGGAYVHDKLFATLSTRTRPWDLGGGDKVILSDTVGFVRDLPHHLVASFKATLEEAIHSDLLLVVLDASDPQAQQQLDTVMQVLDEIGARQKRQLVLNKIDLLDPDSVTEVGQAYPDGLPISAVTGDGLPALSEAVRDQVRCNVQEVQLSVNARDGKAIHFLETHASVLNRRYDELKAIFAVRIGHQQLGKIVAMGATRV